MITNKKSQGYTARHTEVELNSILVEHLRACPHCDERSGILCAVGYELLALTASVISRAGCGTPPILTYSEYK